MSDWWVPPTLRGYRTSSLGADALAGLSLVAVALPSQMATARLAGLPAVAGLYAFIAGSVLYALFGTNPRLSVGADSTIAPVLAVGVASIAVVGTSRYITTMAFAALLVGGLLIVVGLSRLGWIAELLSTPVITGVLAGIAVEIVVRQLPVILGLKGGGTSTIGRVRLVLDQVSRTNGWSVGIAVCVLALIVVGRRFDRRLPGALVGLVLSIVAVDAFGLATHHGVVVLGTIHGGLPHVGLPAASGTELRRLLGPVLTVAFLCVAQTAATVRTSGAALTANDFNRDLAAIGAGSVAAGLMGVLAVDASPPNTAIVATSGARSQLTNLLAAVAIFVVVLTLTSPLSKLPEATLGATLVFISTKLFRVRELRKIFGFDRLEFALATATLLVVALVGIEQGIVLAIVLSLADRTRRAARPRDTLLGREPGTDHWVPVDIGQQIEQVPGVLVYLVYAPLWYGNADYLRLRISQLVEGAPDPVHAVILDADAMSDIDYTGLEALRGLATELRGRGVAIGVARASHLVHHDLKHGALIEQLGLDHLFSSVEEAVNALQRSERDGG
jgi:MFS superfamily sulfate permease-like transporter